jgi:molybdenum cofactor biosynthesis protein B
MAEEELKSPAPERVNCFVVSIAQAQADELEFSAALVKELLETNFHHVVGSQAVKDDAAQVRTIVEQACKHPKIQVIFLAGGSGVGVRDTVTEVLENLYQKHIQGFGELFRMLTYQESGPAAMLAGATAGLVNGRLLFGLTGPEAHVGLAMRELVLPELGRIWFETCGPAGPVPPKPA